MKLKYKSQNYLMICYGLIPARSLPAPGGMEERIRKAEVRKLVG